MFKVVQIHTLAAPPSTYAPINAPQGIISPLATGAVGLAVGALAGAGYAASRKFSTVKDDESTPGSAATGVEEQPGGESQSDQKSGKGPAPTPKNQP